MTTFTVSRRYATQTSIERILEIILGPFGASLMLVTAVVGVVLLIDFAKENQARRGLLLLLVSGFLLIARTFVRVGGGSPVVSHATWDLITAAAFGGLLLGWPCYVAGAVVGRFLGDFLAISKRASIEAAFGPGSAAHGYARRAFLVRELGLGLVLLAFGCFPMAAVFGACALGVLSGVAGQLARTFRAQRHPDGVAECPETMPDSIDGWTLIRAGSCAALLCVVFSDGLASF